MLGWVMHDLKPVVAKSSCGGRVVPLIQQSGIALYDSMSGIALYSWTMSKQLESRHKHNLKGQYLELPMAMGMRKHELYHFADSTDSTGDSPNFRYEAPLIQFFDQHIALIDHARCIQEFSPSSSSIPIDIMVLSKSPRLSISACQEVFPSKLVIADNTNSRRKVAQWKAECEALQIPFHDVREQGAWTLNISSKWKKYLWTWCTSIAGSEMALWA